jgi:hypothetical protein
MWARNKENIKWIWAHTGGWQGVYILYDGSMPVYVGKGHIRHRIKGAEQSKRRGQLWDHFSWYVMNDTKLMHDIEVLILRMLPPNLRALTRQKGNFVEATPFKKQPVNVAKFITRKSAG